MAFCKTRGTPLPGANDTGRMFVPAGLLSQSGRQLNVAHHTWVDYKAACDGIGETGTQRPHAFDD